MINSDHHTYDERNQITPGYNPTSPPPPKSPKRTDTSTPNPQPVATPTPALPENSSEKGNIGDHKGQEKGDGKVTDAAKKRKKGLEPHLEEIYNFFFPKSTAFFLRDTIERPLPSSFHAIPKKEDLSLIPPKTDILNSEKPLATSAGTYKPVEVDFSVVNIIDPLTASMDLMKTINERPPSDKEKEGEEDEDEEEEEEEDDDEEEDEEDEKDEAERHDDDEQEEEGEKKEVEVKEEAKTDIASSYSTKETAPPFADAMEIVKEEKEVKKEEGEDKGEKEKRVEGGDVMDVAPS